MIDAIQFHQLRLIGGFVIQDLKLVDEAFVDSLGRPALAKTEIVGRQLTITVFTGTDDCETSVSIYHEVLEAATVALAAPPVAVLDFNEGDFERAGYDAHARFGPAAPQTLNAMLQFYGFSTN